MYWKNGKNGNYNKKHIPERVHAISKYIWNVGVYLMHVDLGSSKIILIKRLALVIFSYKILI